MPTNLSGNPAIFPTQTAPVAGEPRTAGSVATPFQNAADRTAHLKDRLEFIDPDKTGVRRLRQFATIAALQASTDHPDGTLAVCDANSVLYKFVALETTAEAVPAIVKPTDVGGGAGRWVMQGFGALNVANGIPQLDTNAELATARLAATNIANVPAKKIVGGHITNGIVAWTYNTVTAVFNVPNDSTTRDVTGTSTTFSALKAGDVLDLHYIAWANPKSSPNYLFFSVRVIKPGPSNDDGPEFMSPYLPNGLEVDNKRPLSCARFFTCASDGDYTAVLRVRGTATNTASSVDGVHCKLEVKRP